MAKNKKIDPKKPRPHLKDLPAKKNPKGGDATSTVQATNYQTIVPVDADLNLKSGKRVHSALP